MFHSIGWLQISGQFGVLVVFFSEHVQEIFFVTKQSVSNQVLFFRSAGVSFCWRIVELLRHCAECCNEICGNKMPTRCNGWFLLQILLLAQHVSGHHYAHHQELDNLKTKVPNTTGSNHLYNTFELQMMVIMVPETCWASNKICNKNHLFHIVGILFPHISLLVS